MAARSRSDPLKDYRARRDFSQTPEPQGGRARRGPGKGRRFVVQKHDARRLHYDFRLELDGVLKSWAVTRGPSLDPAERRLAVRTEDHPLDYALFEGTIPKGSYGGGTVMLWDCGTWQPRGDAEEDLTQGALHFRLAGERMKGGWLLVRMKPKGREKRENWLLIKERDESASETADLTDIYVTSVKTGRSMDQIARGIGGGRVWRSDTGREAPSRKRARRGATIPPVRFVPPQLATLVDTAPAGSDWLHEVKYDGYRCLLAIGGDRVVCYTRHGLDWTDRFARLVEPAQGLPVTSALIDGEVVAMNAERRSDFATLQKTLKSGGPIVYFAFDLLSLDGADLTGLPLAERKERLAATLGPPDADAAIIYSDHIAGSGDRLLRRLCAEGFEGIVSKQAGAPYRSGRGRTWLKTKCGRRQEFVIGGWTRSDRRHGFRSLLIGYYEGDRLIYAGHVGTGFDNDTIAILHDALERRAIDHCPFVAVPRATRRGARWAKPDLVAEIAFNEFTPDGVLRHPSFIGLREDKPAREIGRETPQSGPGKRAAMDDTGTTKIAGIALTHPDKVLYPDMGLTKRDIAGYYEAVAEFVMPYLSGHLLSLVRCPGGQQKKCFFQRHVTEGMTDAIRTVAVTLASGRRETYLYVDRLDGLIAGVQMGALELHIWGSRADRVEKPDRIVFDLDPDVSLDFTAVRAAAFEMRDFLKEVGFESFAMLTGGKGIHVVAPLVRRAEWPQVKAFTRAVAQAFATAAPDRFVATMAKARRKGRIFVDYLRNDRTASAIAPWSTRARPGAPVACPVSWNELGRIETAAAFDVHSAAERVAGGKAGAWEDYAAVRQSLTARQLARLGID